MKNSISILSVLIALAIVPSISCSAVSKTKPSPVSKPKPKPGTVLWEFTTDNGRAIRFSPSIGADGTVYFAAQWGMLYAVDSQTGKMNWKTNLGGETAFGSPVLGFEGLIFVYRSGEVCAVDSKSGEKIWVSRSSSVPMSLAIGPDGTVYFGDKNKHVKALNPKTGKIIWSFLTKNEVWFTPVIDAKGNVYIGSSDGIFYALDGKTGELKWKFSDERIHSYSTTSAAIGADGVIYTVAHRTYNEKGNLTGDGLALALDSKDGSKKWEFRLSGTGRNAPTIGTDGTIYVSPNRLYALDSQSGKMKWKSDHSGAGSPAIGDDGTVYFGSYDRHIYAVDGNTGEKKWSVRTGDGVQQSSPVIGDDGTLYIGSNDGRLYAIATSSTGPAKSPWPMFGQNAQRTSRAPAAK